MNETLEDKNVDYKEKFGDRVLRDLSRGKRVFTPEGTGKKTSYKVTKK